MYLFDIYLELIQIIFLFKNSLQSRNSISSALSKNNLPLYVASLIYITKIAVAIGNTL